MVRMKTTWCVLIVGCLIWAARSTIVDGQGRGNRATVYEAVARVVEPGDREALALDRQHAAWSEPERAGGVVAQHHLAPACPAWLWTWLAAGRSSRR